MEVWFTAQKGFAQGLTKMWESHPMWQQDPVMLPYRDAASKLRLFGYAGPRRTRRRPRPTRSTSSSTCTPRPSRACRAEESVKWAEGELKKIYGG